LGSAQVNAAQKTLMKLPNRLSQILIWHGSFDLAQAIFYDDPKMLVTSKVDKMYPKINHSLL